MGASPGGRPKLGVQEAEVVQQGQGRTWGMGMWTKASDGTGGRAAAASRTHARVSEATQALAPTAEGGMVCVGSDKSFQLGPGKEAPPSPAKHDGRAGPVHRVEQPHTRSRLPAGRGHVQPIISGARGLRGGAGQGRGCTLRVHAVGTVGRQQYVQLLHWREA